MPEEEIRKTVESAAGNTTMEGSTVTAREKIIIANALQRYEGKTPDEILDILLADMNVPKLNAPINAPKGEENGFSRTLRRSPRR